MPATAQTNRPYWVTGFENFTAALQYHEARSNGLVTLETVGFSNQGRNLFLAKVGNPANTPVMIISQQHGNEVINTEATLQLLQWLYSSPAAAPIRARRPTVTGPRICAPEPTITLSSSVGWRLPALPLVGLVPPNVTHW